MSSTRYMWVDSRATPYDDSGNTLRPRIPVTGVQENVVDISLEPSNSSASGLNEYTFAFTRPNAFVFIDAVSPDAEITYSNSGKTPACIVTGEAFENIAFPSVKTLNAVCTALNKTQIEQVTDGHRRVGATSINKVRAALASVSEDASVIRLLSFLQSSKWKAIFDSEKGNCSADDKYLGDCSGDIDGALERAWGYVSGKDSLIEKDGGKGTYAFRDGLAGMFVQFVRALTLLFVDYITFINDFQTGRNLSITAPHHIVVLYVNLTCEDDAEDDE